MTEADLPPAPHGPPGPDGESSPAKSSSSNPLPDPEAKAHGRIEHDLERVAADVRSIEERVPGWLRPSNGENRLPTAAAVLIAAAIQLKVPDRYGVHPRWVLPALELVLLVVLTALNPVRLTRTSPAVRYTSIALVALITFDNAFSALLLDHDILTSRASGDAIGLLGSGAAIYVTNIIAFGIWYWELDRGGPVARAQVKSPYPDFLFPQMANPELVAPHWQPRFVDYLYVSFTNAAAFSPTDTLPLSRWAKGLMAVQSAVALSTTALVIARAVNVLK